MAGPEPSQQAHAAEIRQRREAARTGGEMSEAKIQALVDKLVNKAVDAAFAKVQITGTGLAVVSGKFPTLTIAVDPPRLTFTGTGTMDCDADPPTVAITITGG